LVTATITINYACSLYACECTNIVWKLFSICSRL